MDDAVCVTLLCKFLDFPTLKIIRWINRFWKDAAATELLRRGFIVTPPGFHQKPPCQQDGDKPAFLNLLYTLNFPSNVGKKPGGQLREQGETFARRKKVPNIRISQLEDIATFQSLLILGRDVRHLQISRAALPSYTFYFTRTHEEFLQVLKDGRSGWRELEILLTHFTTSLDSVAVFDNKNHSQESTFFNMEELKFFFRVKKAHLIKSLTLCYSGLKCLEDLEHFSSLSPRLLSIRLERLTTRRMEMTELETFNRYVECLNKILESSKDTLQKIEVTAKFGNIENLRIPVFPRVHTINVDFFTDIHFTYPRAPIFPVPVPVALTSRLDCQPQVNFFPKLRCVTVGCERTFYDTLDAVLNFRAPTVDDVKKLLPMINVKVEKKEGMKNYDDKWDKHRRTMIFSRYCQPLFSVSIFNLFRVEYRIFNFLVCLAAGIPFNNEQRLQGERTQVENRRLGLFSMMTVVTLLFYEFVFLRVFPSFRAKQGDGYVRVSRNV